MLWYYAILLLGIKVMQQQYRRSVVQCNALNIVFQRLYGHTHSLPQCLYLSQMGFEKASTTNITSFRRIFVRNGLAYLTGASKKGGKTVYVTLIPGWWSWASWSCRCSGRGQNLSATVTDSWTWRFCPASPNRPGPWRRRDQSGGKRRKTYFLRYWQWAK